MLNHIKMWSTDSTASLLHQHCTASMMMFSSHHTVQLRIHTGKGKGHGERERAREREREHIRWLSCFPLYETSLPLNVSKGNWWRCLEQVNVPTKCSTPKINGQAKRCKWKPHSGVWRVWQETRHSLISFTNSADARIQFELAPASFRELTIHNSMEPETKWKEVTKWWGTGQITLV